MATSHGTVKWFCPHKGFGFVEITEPHPDCPLAQRGVDIFIHSSDVVGNVDSHDDRGTDGCLPKEGDTVSFVVMADERGGTDRDGRKRLRADRVKGGTGRLEDFPQKGKGKDGKGFGKGYDSYDKGGYGGYEKGFGGYGDKGYGKGYDKYGGGKGGFESFGEKGGKGPKPGDWDCTSCGVLNFASRERCFRCNKDRGSAPSYGKGDCGGKGGFESYGKGGYDSYGGGKPSYGGGKGRSDSRGRDQGGQYNRGGRSRSRGRGRSPSPRGRSVSRGRY